jgi:hypothetical protein
MPQETHVRKQLDALKAETKALHELWQSAAQAMDTGRQTGDLQSAQNALAELEVKTAEFKKFRATLSPEVLFLAKYNVEVHGPHEVSFVLPRGMSRIEMLQEAQALVTERSLIYPNHLTKWQQDPKFTAVATTTQRIHINGHVEGGDAKSRVKQEALLTVRGLQMPSKEDLAAAFVAHYIAMKEPLFGFYKNNHDTYFVRAAGGALHFNGHGLVDHDIHVDYRYPDVAVAAALPPLRQGYVGQAGIKK